MSDLASFINNYGSLITGSASLFFIISMKLNNIAAIEKTLDKIEKKVDNVCEVQLDHESRVAHIEGKLNNGRH